MEKKVFEDILIELLKIKKCMLCGDMLHAAFYLGSMIAEIHCLADVAEDEEEEE